MPSLRLIAWNCRSGSLATRLSELSEHSPDIVFIQECAPAKSRAADGNFLTRSVNTSKAIALGSLNPEYRVAALPPRARTGKAVLAASVTGPVSFTALGIWSQAPNYADDAMRSLRACADVLRAGPAVVMGDLNSGTCLHREESPSKNHRRLVDMNTIVFVLSTSGWVSHGPRRASERQARHVARLLEKRLGWITAVGNRAPAVPSLLPSGLPPLELAGLSPVWRDPTLAEIWKRHGR